MLLFPYLEDEDERNPLVEGCVWSGGWHLVAVVDEVARLPVPPLPLYDQLRVDQAANTALGWSRGNLVSLQTELSYLELRSDVKGGVNPAVVVQDCAGHPWAGLTVDGITEILKQGNISRVTDGVSVTCLATPTRLDPIRMATVTR